METQVHQKTSWLRPGVTLLKWTVVGLPCLPAIAFAQAPNTEGTEAKEVAPEQAPAAEEEGDVIEVMGQMVRNPGTYTDTPWLETPQSMQRITRADLEDWGAQTIEDAWQLTAGVTPGDQTLGSRYGGLARIRGIQGSQTLLNGFTVPQRWASFSTIAGLESVVFMKGPADMVDGAQTPSLTVGGFGGQINLLSQRASRRDSLDASLAGRAFGDTEGVLQANINQALIEDELYLKLDLYGQTGRRFYVPDDFSPEWAYAGFGSLEWTPNRDLRIVLRGSWNQSKSYAYKGVPVIYGELVGDYDGFLGDEDSTVDFQGYMTQLEITYDINEYLTAELAGSYIGQNLDADVWAWGIPRGGDFTFADMAETQTGYPTYSSSDATDDIIAARGMLLGRLTTDVVRHKLLVGADVEHRKFDSVSTPWNVPAEPVSILDPILPPLTEGTSGTGPTTAGGTTERETNRVGLMAQYQAEITQYVRLLGGVRVDRHEFKDPRVSVGGGNFEAQEYDKTTPYWRLGATVLPIQRVALYGNYTTGATPNFGEVDENNEAITESQTFGMLEAGVKANVLDNLEVSAAWYTIKQENVPVALPAADGVATGAVGLSGEMEFSGYELTVQGEALPGWRVMGSYAYTDVESDSLFTSAHMRPAHTFSGFTSYRLPGVLKQLRLGAGYRYMDERAVGYFPSADPRNDENKLPAYHIVDALAEYSLPRLMAGTDAYVRLNVSNLLNSEYYVVARQVSETSSGEPLSAMLTFGIRR